LIVLIPSIEKKKARHSANRGGLGCFGIRPHFFAASKSALKEPLQIQARANSGAKRLLFQQSPRPRPQFRAFCYLAVFGEPDCSVVQIYPPAKPDKYRVSRVFSVKKKICSLQDSNL
jgi:hypothetical protein